MAQEELRSTTQLLAATASKRIQEAAESATISDELAEEAPGRGVLKAIRELHEAELVAKRAIRLLIAEAADKSVRGASRREMAEAGGLSSATVQRIADDREGKNTRPYLVEEDLTDSYFNVPGPPTSQEAREIKGVDPRQLPSW